jgi:hypothetical protein
MRFFGWMLMISVLAVPALIASTFYGWFRLRHDLPTWRSILGVSGAVLALTSWTLFIVGVFRGWIGGFGSHYVTRLDVSNFGLAISAAGFLCVFFLHKWSRTFGTASAAIVLFLWGGSQLVA